MERGVFVKNMKMPRGCLECPMLSWWSCRPAGRDIPDEGTTIEYKPDWCPMEEMPVVTCAECRYYVPYEVDGTDGECSRHRYLGRGTLVTYEDYCSDGERKEKL